MDEREAGEARTEIDPDQLDTFRWVLCDIVLAVPLVELYDCMFDIYTTMDHCDDYWGAGLRLHRFDAAYFPSIGISFKLLHRTILYEEPDVPSDDCASGQPGGADPAASAKEFEERLNGDALKQLLIRVRDYVRGSEAELGHYIEMGDGVACCFRWERTDTDSPQLFLFCVGSGQ